ncbi:DUF1800 domain-containing protein [Nocardioides bruguierae]|uniref:DUF1800 domain-containing protein n=1 Tax=Nocardioides bruguierae TaxID=2945102 RepID=UPI00201FF815|nr:DUF1800 domain-containing protein [Nocardioides bruguierae]MCL8025631.1 DUF1800 domain-containing protein [Nocardioides bruguierae]
MDQYSDQTQDRTQPDAPDAGLATISGRTTDETLAPYAAKESSTAVTASTSARPVALPSAAGRHVLNRFSWGITPGLARAVAGGKHLAWFDAQLAPARIKDGPGSRADRWWPDLRRTPLDQWMRYRDGTKSNWDMYYEHGQWVMAKRLLSHRQLLEVMTAFWENHLHVPLTTDGHFVWRPSYARLIRKHALGRFDQMLAEATLHPAMLCYLDAAISTKIAPNENLGRELLELHTVGVGHYSERDVKSSAAILTGWRVDINDTWQRLYVPEYHATGAVRVGSFRSANRSSDGRAVTRQYLHYLAHHPDTARHLATKLATAFVSDDPPRTLVTQLAKVYLDADTRIAPVLRTLVRSKQFRGSVDEKLRTVDEDLLATFRALRMKVTGHVDGNSGTGVLRSWTGSLGLSTGSWPAPNGAPLTADYYATPLRALASVSAHWSVANRWYPTQDTVYRTPDSWLPALPATFRQICERMCRELLYRPLNARLLTAMATAAQVSDVDESLNADSIVVRYRLNAMLAALLDSPEHYAR